MSNPQVSAALRKAAVRASRAPSIHNTQPWRFVLGHDWLDIYTDPSRRLHVLDPYGRQLTLSCGCALFNARVALAAAGFGVTVARFPEPAQPQLAARIGVNRSVPVAVDLAAFDPVIETRQTNRRAFTDEDVPGDIVKLLVDAARNEDAELDSVAGLEDRLALAQLSQLADRQELLDPAYRAELRAWTTDDPYRRDGVAANAVPRVDAGAEDDVPIRDFDTRGSGGLPTNTRSSLAQCLLLLGAREDNETSWLRAGEALERILLVIAQHGYAASPLTQVIEVAYTNALMRSELRLRMNPQVLLRVGQAPRTPETRRRRLVDVLTETN